MHIKDKDCVTGGAVPQWLLRRLEEEHPPQAACKPRGAENGPAGEDLH